MTGAPARIYELPFAVVDLDGVPSVGAVFGGDRFAWLEGREAGAFPVAADDERFEASLACNGGEETSVAFADREASGESAGWRGRFDCVVAKGDDVVGNVMVEPGEDGAGLVSG